MIAVLQFDAAGPAQVQTMVAQGHLPALAGLCGRGTWYDVDTPATFFEGAAARSLYTGKHLGEHGLYYPWLWSAAEQRVRCADDLPEPEAVWERVGREGRRSLVVDPYEMRPPKAINGIFLSGWQFKNRVVLRTRSVPASLHRDLARELGRPPSGEEVYGRPAATELLRLRDSLVAAPHRGAVVLERILEREKFDLIWLSVSAAHMGGHRFLDVTRFAQEIELDRHPRLATALLDIYRSVDEALGRMVAVLPRHTDLLVVSPTGMGPNTSRFHLLPGMLHAVTGNRHARHSARESSLWRIRATVPTRVRAAIADAMPDRWALQLAARLELRGVDWTRTTAFMVPSDDAGYVRINLRGRERDGIVDPGAMPRLLDELAEGLRTFQDADGAPVVREIVRPSELGYRGPCADQLPDLVVRWADRLVTPLAGVSSPRFGVVRSPGWGTGRTGCHTGDAWVLIVPGTSRLKPPVQPPHIVDVVPTICAVLGADLTGLAGQPLLEPGGSAGRAASRSPDLNS